MATAKATNRIQAVGRRKNAVARVALTPGTGKILVNHREIEDYLTVQNQREHAIQPLHVTQTKSKFDVAVNVNGGGVNGQAGAIRHAIARALVKAVPESKPTLKAGGFLTRDPRMKERKKYGQPGARKRYQFSKR